MRLASLKSASPDGRLVAVSSDHKSMVSAEAVAATMREAVERWDDVEAPLRALAARLEDGTAEGAVAFDPVAAAAPLPRCFSWLDGSAFVSHGDLMTRAFRRAPGPDARTIPLMYQGASDDFIGGTDDIVLPRTEDGIDFEAEIGVITRRVAMGTPASEALDRVCLVVLLNDVSLRSFGPREMATGFGFLHAKPTTSFAPVAVTPDELGAAWGDARLYLPVEVKRDGERFGAPHAGEMYFGFDALIAHAAHTRTLSAGTIVGSGTISNAAYAAVGSACIAERRAVEMIEHGEPLTPYLSFGERVSIEMRDSDGRSVFGAIDQRVVCSDRRVNKEGE